MSLGYSKDDINSASAESQRLRKEREEETVPDKFRLFFGSANRKRKKMMQTIVPQPVETLQLVIALQA